MREIIVGIYNSENEEDDFVYLKDYDTDVDIGFSIGKLICVYRSARYGELELIPDNKPDLEDVFRQAEDCISEMREKGIIITPGEFESGEEYMPIELRSAHENVSGNKGKWLYDFFCVEFE